MPLFWRLFLINALLFTTAALALALSPATVSRDLTVREATVLAVGVLMVLIVNLVLVRRTLDPLRRLSSLMGRVDLTHPGQRLPVTSGGPEIIDLATAFNEMLDRLEAERRASGQGAIDAQERERRRVALELHDEVGQTLTGVVLGLDGLTREVPSDLRDRVESMQAVVRDGAERVREIARGLRPESLEEFGLRTALIGLFTGMEARTDLRVERHIASALPPLSREAELVVYRVAQESLTNVARHAEAARARVFLEPHPGFLELRVVDDGCGIGDGALSSSRGLAGMHERALYVGGSLDVRRPAEGGTEICLRLPTSEIQR